MHDVHGLVQDCSNSIANTLQLLKLCTKPSMYSPRLVTARSIAGPRLNIKTVLSTYGDFHVKDKTAVRSLIFNMGITIPCKTVFLIETAPWSHVIHWKKYKRGSCFVVFSFGSVWSMSTKKWWAIRYKEEFVLGSCMLMQVACRAHWSKCY